MYKKNVLFLIFPPRRKSAKPSRFIYSILELSIFCFSRIFFFLFKVMLIIFPPLISFTPPLIPSPLRGNLAVFISSDFGPTAVQLQVQSIKEFKVVIKHITKYQILTGGNPPPQGGRYFTQPQMLLLTPVNKAIQNKKILCSIPDSYVVSLMEKALLVAVWLKIKKRRVEKL